MNILTYIQNITRNIVGGGTLDEKKTDISPYEKAVNRISKAIVNVKQDNTRLLVKSEITNIVESLDK